MSFAELLWLIYTETLEGLRQNQPSNMRRFLNSVRDWETLRAWDNEQMKDRASDGGRGDGF